MTAFAFSEPRDANDIIFIGGGHDHQLIQPPDDGRDMALIQRIKAGDFDARQQLIASNLRHVLHSNRRYSRNGTRIFDLLKAGNQGLVYALENFAAGSQRGFPEFADTCIRQHIERVLTSSVQAAKSKSAPSGVRPCHQTHLQARWLRSGHNQTARQTDKLY